MALDMTTVDRKAARMLIRARRLLNDGGKHWIKGNFKRDIKPGVVGYCSVGALLHVRDSKPDLSDPDAYERAMRMLADTVFETYAEEAAVEDAYDVNEEDSETIITTWNDQGNRTWNDIDEAFRKSALALKK